MTATKERIVCGPVSVGGKTDAREDEGQEGTAGFKKKEPVPVLEDVREKHQSSQC